MYEAVIFDFDGVIVNSEPLHYQACCAVFQKIGIAISHEEYMQKYVGLSDKELFPHVFQEKQYHFSADEIHAFIQEKIKHYTDIISNITQFPVITGLENFIDHLVKQNKMLAICSGSTKEEIASVLKKWNQHHLKDHFKTMVTSEDVIHGKPSPEGYLLTAKRLNIPTQHCLVIEDSPFGITAAKNAGMFVVALLTSHSRQVLKDADLIVNNFDELFLRQS